MAIGLISAGVSAFAADSDYVLVSTTNSGMSKMYLNTNSKYIKKSKSKNGTAYQVWILMDETENKTSKYSNMRVKANYNVTGHVYCHTQVNATLKDGTSNSEDFKCEYDDISPDSVASSVEDYLIQHYGK
jgi:acyl-ACP thioesterase